MERGGVGRFGEVERDTGIGSGLFYESTGCSLALSNLYRAAEVRDLDLDLLAGRRGLGRRTVEEIALLRGVLRYRSRSPAPDRAAFEAALPRNRIPLSWQIALKADRVETLDLSKRARG